jgi:hypothetical protein
LERIMEITLKLTADEVNGILNVLGELPTKTGAYVLLMKIKEQAETQLPPPVQTAQAN